MCVHLEIWEPEESNSLGRVPSWFHKISSRAAEAAANAEPELVHRQMFSILSPRALPLSISASSILPTVQTWPLFPLPKISLPKMIAS